MIIEFKVSNFRSINKKQTFSMVASSATELENNLCDSDCEAKFRLVRAAVLYGANASGKSNLLRALFFMRNFIITSAKESQQGEKISLESFVFDKTSSSGPSEFEITFIKEKIRYQYGFVADSVRVYEEWLFVYPFNKAQKWFSRIYDEKLQEYSWSFSKFFKKGKYINQLTRSNTLFLSNAVQLNNEQLAPVFDWFQKDLVLIDSPSSKELTFEPTIEFLKTKDGKKRLLKLMVAADASITDIKLDVKKIDENKIHFPSSMPQEVQEYIKKEIMNQESAIINFIHKDENLSLKFHFESEGTYRLFAYAGHWFEALDKGYTLVVDELDNSLHPLLVRFLVKLICDPEINKNNAQLIFSTHDTSLLDNELFRRDQIWFVEKDKANSTQLYSLLDFSPRKHEALERGYLQGRYGALPYIGGWDF